MNFVIMEETAVTQFQLNIFLYAWNDEEHDKDY